MLFEKGNYLIHDRIEAYRCGVVAVAGVLHRGGPEDVDAGGLEGGAELDGFEATDPQALDSGAGLVLRHGRLHPGPPAVAIPKLRGLFIGLAFGQAKVFVVITQITETFAFAPAGSGGTIVS